jgi:hypothetical protein
MSWVPAVGCGLIFAWLVATGWWWGSLTKAQGLLAGAAICSPPVVLAMERGNCDQIVFLLAILALTALHRGFRIAAWAMIFFAFALKLFPAAGFVVFLRLGWRKASAWLAITAVLMTGYLFYKHDEMRTVLYNTPGDFLMSYGATHWTKLADHWVPALTGERYAFHHLEGQSSLWAALLFLGALWKGHSRRDRETEAGPDRYLDGFRLGACIYALTFIAGTNYFYRLVFLLLCLPWLWKSDSAGTRIGKMRWLGLTLIFSVLWINPYWWPPLALGSEASAWGLLCVTGWLLGATLPKWERRPNPHP